MRLKILNFKACSSNTFRNCDNFFYLHTIMKNILLKNIKYILGYFTFTLIIVSCKNENTKQTKSENRPSSFTIPTNFNADSAYLFIEKQVKIGKRIPNTEPHVKTKDYLVSKFVHYGWITNIQSFDATAFDGKKLKLYNIIASINPEKNKRILLCAHWDTRPFADQEDDMEKKLKPIDGANDGGSGVAVLLEFARSISIAQVKPSVGIDIILFDGEDYGQPDFLSMKHQNDTWCLGSQYWSKNPHKPNYQAFYGILLDMVGGKNAKFALEGTSRYYAPHIQKKIWDKANSIGLGNYFIYTVAPEIIDDHYYINKLAQIPTIDIIEYDPTNGNYFGKYWHKHEDNLTIIDKKTLSAVGTLLLHIVYDE